MLVGGRPQVLWEGLAELRADAPSKARGAEGERGRPPPSSNTQRPITPRTRQTRPTKIVTFPRDKAEKSPFQQHDLSILIVGPDQLKYRLSRTRKPKSQPSSNTQCPITRPRAHPRAHARIPGQARRTAVRVAPLLTSLTSTTTPPCTDTPARAHSPVSAERSHGLVNWRGEKENTQRNSGRTPRGEYKKAGSEDPA